ncbi:LysR family transcriptional regulator [Paenibacillus sp. J45TS6]|uniref:LysR family transcriptional regulator n=1 Tax=Paenibacillus sp. J45TS6 TaxID=2807196 RepID=UPI001B1314FC|nr:LysR family transcriptional regulator [Paenibacillus sp. J45TS6]GIP44772.1 LysR family transcriptional regulator [Paenibacillus sp. J45TS6]
MNLRHLQYFQVLAELEHFTQASAKLHITQPSLSHAISELEKKLGVPLFEKKGRNVRLTKYGRVFLEHVDKALSELSKGEQKIQELASPNHGRVDLAFIYTLGPHFAPSLIQSFTSREEFKDITLSFHQGNTQTLIQELKNDTFDIAFCSFLPEEQEHIEFIPVTKEELVVIVHPEHPLANQDSIDLKDTAGYPFIFFNEASGVRPIIDDLFAQVDVTPHIICEIEEDNAMAGLVSVNYGIGIMPRISTLNHFQVKALPISNPSYERYIYMATIKNRYLSPAAVAFRDYVIAHCQGNSKKFI